MVHMPHPKDSDTRMGGQNLQVLKAEPGIARKVHLHQLPALADNRLNRVLKQTICEDQPLEALEVGQLDCQFVFEIAGVCYVEDLQVPAGGEG
jgi:hypothetical protein